MKKKIIILGIIVFSLFIFSYARAAGPVKIVDVCDSANMKSIEGIINWATCLLSKAVIPFLFGLATTAFIWGVIQFYLNPDNEEKRKKGKSFIIGGLIALFVMVSMWGIVKVLTNTFEVENAVPQLPTN